MAPACLSILPFVGKHWTNLVPMNVLVVLKTLIESESKAFASVCWVNVQQTCAHARRPIPKTVSMRCPYGFYPRKSSLA